MPLRKHQATARRLFLDDTEPLAISSPVPQQSRPWSKAGDAQFCTPRPSSESCHLRHPSHVLEGVSLFSVHLEGPLGLDQYCEHKPMVVTTWGLQRKVMNSPACLPLTC